MKDALDWVILACLVTFILAESAYLILLATVGYFVWKLNRVAKLEKERG